MPFKRTLLILITFLLVSGIQIARFSFPEQYSSREKLPHGYYDYKGLIHLHTTYSDGEGTVKEVAETGNLSGLDFLVSTDHNTLEPLQDSKEGWYQNLLFLVGEEISMQGGYTLGLNISKAIEHGREKEPQSVVDEVREQGGMAFIAHPLNWRFGWENWDVQGITGMEILDLDDLWRKTNPILLLWGLITFPVNPSYALLNILHKPQDVLDKWDELTQKKIIVGIYSPDLHDQIRIKKDYYIKFPPREETMPLASNHILLKKPFNGELSHDKKLLYDALRNGHLYFSLDLLGSPNGFIFKGVTTEGGQYLMGDSIDKNKSIVLEASLGHHFQPETYHIRLFHNGSMVEVASNRPLHYEPVHPGAYRVEVEILWESPFYLKHPYTWIYSNPIYIG